MVLLSDLMASGPAVTLAPKDMRAIRVEPDAVIVDRVVEDLHQQLGEMSHQNKVSKLCTNA